MDVTIINPFLTACENAFKNMFNVLPDHKAPYLLDVIASRHWEISGLLGLTGDYSGIIAFRLHKVLADKMLENAQRWVGAILDRDLPRIKILKDFYNKHQVLLKFLQYFQQTMVYLW